MPPWMDTFFQTVPKFAPCTFISCWHESARESAAMWDLYSDAGKGVAIVTTWGRLIDSLKTDFKVRGGRVTYLDYAVDPAPWNLITIYTCKRDSFAHEREVRLIVQDITPLAASESEGLKYPDSGPQGPFATAQASDGVLKIPVDLHQMVSQIRVSPRAPKWWVPVLREVVDKYGHDWPIDQSNLYDRRLL